MRARPLVQKRRRDGRGEAAEEGQQQRDAEHCEGQRPGVKLSASTSSRAADPLRGRQGNSRSRTTTPVAKAGRRRFSGLVASLAVRRRREPDERREGDEAGGEEIVGRLRQHQQRAGGKGGSQAAPAPQQDYSPGEALHVQLPSSGRYGLPMANRLRVPENHAARLKRFGTRWNRAAGGNSSYPSGRRLLHARRMAAAPTFARSTMRTRFTRRVGVQHGTRNRGSPAPPPRTGTRPSVLNTMPPIVSTAAVLAGLEVAPARRRGEWVAVHRRHSRAPREGRRSA